ncbi:MAG: hypothetical protein KC621_31400, partial [Myxococcales bacterium]|nr:hypothetical protein [Myxococcales bacterium]
DADADSDTDADSDADTDTAGCLDGDGAALVADGHATGTVCAGGEARHAVTLPGGDCRVTLDLAAATADLRVELDGAPATTVADGEGVAVAVPAGSSLRAVVAGAGAYDVTAAASCSTTAASCPGEDVWEQNDDDDEGVFLPIGADLDGVVCASTDWDVFAFETQPGCIVDVSVQTTYAPDRNVDLYLDVLNDYGTWDTWINALTEDDDERITTVARRSSYHARVLGTAGAGTPFVQGSYGLRVDLDCHAWTCPADDPYDGGRGNDTVSQSITFATGEVADAIVCGSDHDVWYLPANACAPTVTLTWDPADGELGADLFVGASNPLSNDLIASSSPSPGTLVIGSNTNLLGLYFDVRAVSGSAVPYQATFSCP